MNRVTKRFISYVVNLVKQGAPRQTPYDEFTQRIAEFDAAKRDDLVSQEDESAVFDGFGDAFSVETMQGFVVQRPHGYVGDFEMIDRIYTGWTSPRQDLVAWDQYFHSQAAPKAVVNRKAYFQDLLSRVSASRPSASILNLGSGPGRCIREWLDAHPDANVQIDCVDLNSVAIEYARKLNEPHQNRVAFHHRNALCFRPDYQYDLIWAAGLFDYFEDRTFIAAAKRMLAVVASNGELVIGNFSVENSTRSYMELGGWRLHHRSPHRAARDVGVWSRSRAAESQRGG